MIFRMHQHSRALARQVSEAECQLRVRRQQLRDSTQALDQAVRQRVTAPDVLLWSVAGGFALGELTRKHAPDRVSRKSGSGHVSDDQAEADEKRPSSLQLLLGYISIARPIISGVMALLAPYLQHMQTDAADETARQAEGNALSEAASADPPLTSHPTHQPA